eukprot:UN07874
MLMMESIWKNNRPKVREQLGPEKTKEKIIYFILQSLAHDLDHVMLDETSTSTEGFLG